MAGEELARRKALAPGLIPVRVLGARFCQQRDNDVSAQRTVLLVANDKTGPYFEEREVLRWRAEAPDGYEGIDVVECRRPLYPIMFDQHE